MTTSPKYGNKKATAGTDAATEQTAPTPDLAGLLQARIDGGDQRTIKRNICLDRRLLDELDLAADDDVRAEVMGRIAQASISVTLRPVEPAKAFDVRRSIITLYGGEGSTPVAAMEAALLVEALVSASSLDGDPVEVTGDQWRGLIATMTEGEVASLWAPVEAAMVAPSFPM